VPTATILAKLDLAADRTFTTDISAYLVDPQDLGVDGLGREGDMDAAGPSRCQVLVDNADGRFSTKNSGSPYYPNLKPGILIRVQVPWNAVTYDYFLGIVTEIEVLPMPGDKLARLTCIDMMAVLAATDTRLAAMESQYTGVIIDRLLDGAEGELVNNPRFESDLTGYSAIGGASAPVRVTAGDLLHLPAAMTIAVSNASASGWRYDITSKTAAGQKVTAAAYVRAEADADVGKTVVARIADNGGVRATSSVITLTASYQRVAVSGTFDGASTARYVDVVTDAAQGVFTFRTGASHAVAAVAAIPRAVDSGVATIERAYYPRTPALAAIQEIRDNELGGLFFIEPAGVATFQDRSHRFREAHSRTSQATIAEKFKAISYRESLDDRPSEVRFYYTRWDVGAQATVFSLAPAPRAIPANGSLTVEIDYGGGLVRNTVVPVANTHWKANSLPDGTGSDDSGSLTFTFQDFGGAAEAKFTNSLSRSVYLTMLDVIGTPVRPASDDVLAIATPTTPPPLSNPLVHTYPLQTSEPHVQSWADYHAKRHGDTQREQMSIVIDAPWPDAATGTLMAQVLGLDIGDRITISDTTFPFGSKVNGDYYVDSISRRVVAEQGGGRRAEATLQMSPADLDYWILDTGKLDDSAGVDNARLAI